MSSLEWTLALMQMVGAYLLVVGTVRQFGLAMAESWGWQLVANENGRAAELAINLERATRSRRALALIPFLIRLFASPGEGWSGNSATTGHMVRRRLKWIPEEKWKVINDSAAHSAGWLIMTLGASLVFLSTVVALPWPDEDNPGPVMIALGVWSLALWLGDRPVKRVRARHEAEASAALDASQSPDDNQSG